MNQKPDCLHHWVIAPATSAKSPGKCRKCEEERYFDNSMPDVNTLNWINKAQREETE